MTSAPRFPDAPHRQPVAVRYPVGTRLVLVGHGGAEWPVEVTGHNSLDCDLLVRWTGRSPSLDKQNTVCLAQLWRVKVQG